MARRLAAFLIFALRVESAICIAVFHEEVFAAFAVADVDVEFAFIQLNFS